MTHHKMIHAIWTGSELNSFLYKTEDSGTNKFLCYFETWSSPMLDRNL